MSTKMNINKNPKHFYFFLLVHFRNMKKAQILFLKIKKREREKTVQFLTYQKKERIYNNRGS